MAMVTDWLCKATALLAEINAHVDNEPVTADDVEWLALKALEMAAALEIACLQAETLARSFSNEIFELRQELQALQLRADLCRSKAPECAAANFDMAMAGYIARNLAGARLTYRVLSTPQGSAIQCLHCNRVSYHQEDIENLYCAYCRQFHDPDNSGGLVK